MTTCRLKKLSKKLKIVFVRRTMISKTWTRQKICEKPHTSTKCLFAWVNFASMMNLNDLAGHQIGPSGHSLVGATSTRPITRDWVNFQNFHSIPDCNGSMTCICENSLQVAKDLVTFAFLRLSPHIGKIISKGTLRLLHKPNIIRLTKFSIICIFRYLKRKRWRKALNLHTAHVQPNAKIEVLCQRRHGLG